MLLFESKQLHCHWIYYCLPHLLRGQNFLWLMWLCLRSPNNQGIERKILQDRLSVYSYTYSQLVYTYCHWQTAGSELEGHNKTGHAITLSRYHRMRILIVRRHILCFCVECVRSRKLLLRKPSIFLSEGCQWKLCMLKSSATRRS